jgi:hypothetical protein
VNDSYYGNCFQIILSIFTDFLIITMKGGESIPNKKTPMTPAAAQRIQSAADRSNTNQGLKSRAMQSADKNSKK